MLGKSTRGKRSDIGQQTKREKINVENSRYETANMSFYSTPPPNKEEVVDITTDEWYRPDFTLTHYPRQGKL